LKIEPQIMTRHWQQAAADQLTKELVGMGYQVERDARLGDGRADLIARKGDTTVVYEIKTPGPGGEGWGESVIRLREAAIASGARFKIAFVRPPRRAEATVEGIEVVLLTALRADPPFDRHKDEATVRIEDVLDVEIDAIAVRSDGVDVRGNATVSVSLRQGEADCGTDDLPFSFDVTLHRDGSLAAVRDLTVDLSSWYATSELNGAARATG
jgi:hypothetical protein